MQCGSSVGSATKGWRISDLNRAVTSCIERAAISTYGLGLKSVAREIADEYLHEKIQHH